MSESLNQIVNWPSGKLDFSAGCLIMGVLNITPDSFSDGGLYFSAEKAVEHGLQMAADGASIIDIGPESTRPGSLPVDAKEQIRRAVSVIQSLRRQVSIPISIDTTSPEVAAEALAAGANIINDIDALTNTRMAALAAERQVPVVLMHKMGTPATMQQNPAYDDVVRQVKDYLLQRARAAQSAGIQKDHIFIDPGIGFAKTIEHNLVLLKHLDFFTSTGYRVLIGTSRKRFIGQITGKNNPSDRIFGTAATVADAIVKGASIVRVHDVACMADVVKVSNAIIKAK